MLPILGLILAVTVLCLNVDIGRTLDVVAGAHLPLLAAALGLAILATAIAGLKLGLLARLMGQPRSVRRCWLAVMGGLTLNVVLPSKGGDLAKAAFLADDPGQITPFFGAVLVERAFDLIVLGLLALGGALVEGRPDIALVGAAVVVAAALGMALLANGRRLPIWSAKAERLGRAARRVLRHPGGASILVCLSVSLWANALLIMACLLRALGAAVPIVALLTAGPVAILAGLLPVSVSGIGTRDGALVLLLADHLPSSTVLGAGLLYTAVVYWFLAALGLPVVGFKALRGIRATIKAVAAGAKPEPDRDEDAETG